jgi:microcystin-dependent protein
MADDRAVEDLTTAVARLNADLADLRSTALVRAQTGMTGDIEPTIRTTAKVGTLLLQGQTLNRADFAALWQWASDQGLVGVAGLFGVGDGSLTFTIPDMRGRVPVAAGSFGPDTYAVGAKGGAARVAQTIAQMARHSHTGGTSSTGSHFHANSFGSGSGGTHGVHPPAQIAIPAGNNGAQDVWAGGGVSLGSHTHSVSGDSSTTGSHSHTIPLDGGTTGGAGPGADMDVRQPYFALNWLIWT